ncbi:MAG: hypothetical protein K8T90_16995 [Planctomycetes bacterium]|nr:hypothetical protein [Planctomycetota bacterium]
MRSKTVWSGLVTCVGALALGSATSAGADEFEPGADIESHIARRLGLDSAAVRDAARRRGAMRLTGRTHLSGRIIVNGFRVEPGAEVTLEPGTTIVSVGDLRIDAPLRTATTRRARLRPGKAGKVKPLSLLCIDGGIVVTEEARAADGVDGASVDEANSATARGGDGTAGQSIVAKCTGTITLQQDLVPGAGGHGGSATCHGEGGTVGRNGGKATAVAGDAGDAGSVTIEAGGLVSTGGRIVLRWGRPGGAALATGGDGGAAESAHAGSAGDGGAATATGGDAGKPTRAAVTIVTASAPTGFVLDTVFSVEPNALISAFTGAYGGAGGSVPAASGGSECAARGRKGADGGSSGAAKAVGCSGADAAQATIAFVPRRGTKPALVLSGAGAASDGGDATANTGTPRAGGAGETAKSPGYGGAGGGVGATVSVGGRGGDRLAGALGLGGASTRGGNGGTAVSRPKNGADGGAGGSCCGVAAHRSGAPGGTYGVVRRPTATGGKGGKGDPIGVDGVEMVDAAQNGKAGARGQGCEKTPTVTVSDLDINLGSVPKGQETSDTLTITNGTGASVTVNVAGLSGDFFAFPKGDVVIPAGETVTITVGLSSNTTGNKSQTLTLTAPEIVGGSKQVTVHGKVN